MDFIVEVSARHVHLSEKDAEVLFGKNYQLTFFKELSQPGQFACKEKVTIKNGDRSIANVSILGPYRKASQVEISMTDSVALRIEGVIRDSGNTAGTPGITLVGPNGEVELKEGLIVAQRHIHVTDVQAKEHGLTDKQMVSVSIETPQRSLIFNDVIVRVSPAFALAMHIDTDEANAANIPKSGCKGKIIKVVKE